MHVRLLLKKRFHCTQLFVAIVAAVEYRDGTLIDVVRQVKR